MEYCMQKKCKRNTKQVTSATYATWQPNASKSELSAHNARTHMAGPAIVKTFLHPRASVLKGKTRLLDGDIDNLCVVAEPFACEPERFALPLNSCLDDLC